MAGFVISNVRGGLLRQYHWEDVAALPQDGSVIQLDVRTEREFERGHIEGSVNIPLDELRDNLSRLDPAKPIYVNCHSGLRSYLACRILSGNGFTCYNLSGGYRHYAQVMEDRDFDAAPRHPCGLELGADRRGRHEPAVYPGHPVQLGRSAP